MSIVARTDDVREVLEKGRLGGTEVGEYDVREVLDKGRLGGTEVGEYDVRRYVEVEVIWSRGGGV
jgi:hypothetical protein